MVPLTRRDVVVFGERPGPPAMIIAAGKAAVFAYAESLARRSRVRIPTGRTAGRWRPYKREAAINDKKEVLPL